VSILGIRTQSTARDQRDIWANFRGGHATINFQYFDSVKNYFTSRQATFRRQSGQVWRSRDGRRVRSRLRWIKIPTGITCRLSSLSKHSENGQAIGSRRRWKSKGLPDMSFHMTPCEP